jgi:hypothetical protein
MPTLVDTLLASVCTQAVSAVNSAKKELHEAEMHVMRCDTVLINAKAHMNTVVKAINTVDQNVAEQKAAVEKATEQKAAVEKSAFKEMTDAIQTIQMYAITNGKSLGPTMDALIERLFSKEPDVALKKTTDAIQTLQIYASINGIALGSTMDALTQRLFSKERVEA